MPRLVCPSCELTYTILKNGIIVFEMAGQRVYKIWHSDMWECRGCQKKILAGFGQEGIGEWEPGFEKMVERIKADSNAFIVYEYEKLSDRPETP